MADKATKLAELGRESQKKMFARILKSFAEWGRIKGRCPCCGSAWPYTERER